MDSLPPLDVTPLASTQRAWTEQEVARLRELHAQTAPTLSTAEIGRLMGRGKGSILKKTRTLDLPWRYVRPGPPPRCAPDAPRARKAPELPSQQPCAAAA
jgi:hypothetical protein